MASRKENLKSLFSNTRTRVIIIFTFALVLISILIGYVKLKNNESLSLSSNLSNAPSGIQSIPGALDPTQQYAKLQEQQNVDQAQTAEQSGTSSIPTIIRTQAIGEGVGVIGSQTGVGFTALEREDEGGPQRSLWIQSLQNSHCSKSAIDQVLSQGAQLSDLKSACSCVQLKDTGYGLKDLEPICACKELKAAGYNARQLKDTGYSSSRLRDCGFDACELKNAGYTAQEMKDGGFSDGELKGAGFSSEEIAKASGLPDGISESDVRNAGCNATALMKLRDAGVSASSIRRITGCKADQLKAAGFSANELKGAGFSAADLSKAGFTPDQLKDAGYTARDLLNAGFTPEDLANAGYSDAQIKAGETELPPGISEDDVKTAGCNVDEIKRERAAGVSATLIKQYAGCSASVLKAAGFKDSDLAHAGFSPKEITGAGIPVSNDAIKAAGCDPTQLKKLFAQGVSAGRIKEISGCSPQALKDAGYDAKSLMDAGFTPAQLLSAGFSPQQIKAGKELSDAGIKAAGCDPNKLKNLLASGVSAGRIKELNGCSVQALKDAGFDAKSLLDAGFTPTELSAAGFSPQEIRVASQESEAGIKAAGCDPSQLTKLMAAGVSATRIKELNGCSIQALKEAGYGAKALMEAGFTPNQLRAAGFSPQEITAASSPISDDAVKAAGCDPTQLNKLFSEGVSAARIRQINGCSVDDLKAAGYNAKTLMDAGFTPAQLLAAGFSAKQLEASGVSPADIIAAGRNADCSPAYLRKAKESGLSVATIKETLGCSAQSLKDAGYSAKELKDAGFTAAELKSAGFDPRELRSAGYSPADLRNAGFSASQLKDAGYSAKDLKDAGFSPSDLKNAGFSAAQLKNAGYSAKDLKDAGYSAAELKNAGYKAKDLKEAGYSAAELQNAGYTADQIAAAGFSPQDSSVPGLSQPSLTQGNSSITGLPSIPGANQPAATTQAAANNEQLEKILEKQKDQMAEQKYQQKIQQRTSDMLAAANQSIQAWKVVSSQVYAEGNANEKTAASDAGAAAADTNSIQAGAATGQSPGGTGLGTTAQQAAIKTGDILFAVMDTSVNSDEPGPILATIVSGRFKGTKLIGSFNLPSNANSMVITFNTMSVPGSTKTTSISAFAVDPNTA